MEGSLALAFLSCLALALSFAACCLASDTLGCRTASYKHHQRESSGMHAHLLSLGNCICHHQLLHGMDNLALAVLVHVAQSKLQNLSVL